MLSFKVYLKNIFTSNFTCSWLNTNFYFKLQHDNTLLKEIDVILSKVSINYDCRIYVEFTILRADLLLWLNKKDEAKQCLETALLVMEK